MAKSNVPASSPPHHSSLDNTNRHPTPTCCLSLCPTPTRVAGITSLAACIFQTAISASITSQHIYQVLAPTPHCQTTSPPTHCHCPDSSAIATSSSHSCSCSPTPLQAILTPKIYVGGWVSHEGLWCAPLALPSPA